jgi:hypothetical protein
MKIEFETTVDDLTDFNLYVAYHHPRLKRKMLFNVIFLLFGICVFITIGALSLIGFKDTLFAIIVLFAAVLLVVYYFVTFTPKRVRTKIKKLLLRQNRKLPNEEICRRKVTISPEDISSSSEFGEAATPWSAITEIVRTDSHLFLFMDPVKACIVPKRAFRDEASFDRFVETARDYQLKAKPG